MDLGRLPHPVMMTPMLAVTLALAEPIELPTKYEPPPSNEGIATLATAGAIVVSSAAS